MTSPILDESAVEEIEARLERLLSALTFGEPKRGNRYVESVDGDFYFEENADNEFDAFDLLRQFPALCATVKHLRAENSRVYTPSICEALRLLDDAGYGKEVPNSLSEMIKKALAQLEQLRAENERLRAPRMFPIQGGAPAVRWELAEKAYTTYAKLFGTDQSLQRLAERGGFGLGEFACLYLGHDPRCKSSKACVVKIEAEIGYIARLESRLAQVEQERDRWKRRAEKWNKEKDDMLTDFTKALEKL